MMDRGNICGFNYGDFKELNQIARVETMASSRTFMKVINLDRGKFRALGGSS